SQLLSLAWSPGSKSGAFGYIATRAILWDAASGRDRATLDLGSIPGNLSWSPGGATVALARADGIQLWDAATGKRKQSNLNFVPMPEPTSSAALPTATPFNYNDYFNIQRVAWSRDWRNLATITGPSVWIWDFASGKQL